MLPPELHKEACKLLCVWLHRLEERDRRNAQIERQKSQKEVQPTTTSTDTDAELAYRIPPRSLLSDLPTSEHTGTKEKCQCGDAEG